MNRRCKHFSCVGDHHERLVAVAFISDLVPVGDAGAPRGERGEGGALRYCWGAGDNISFCAAIARVRLITQSRVTLERCVSARASWSGMKRWPFDAWSPEQVFVMLRDGTKLIGTMRSFDQYGVCVCVCVCVVRAKRTLRSVLWCSARVCTSCSAWEEDDFIVLKGAAIARLCLCLCLRLCLCPCTCLCMCPRSRQRHPVPRETGRTVAAELFRRHPICGGAQGGFLAHSTEFTSAPKSAFRTIFE